jgi:WD40 repeat protein
LKEKVALEEKLELVKIPVKRTLRDFSLECIEMIARHIREIKKFEDWLSEKQTWPLKFEMVSDVSSVKLKAGVMSSVPLSFFSSGGKGMVFIGFWSVSGGKEVASLAGHTNAVISVAFSPDVATYSFRKL